MVDDSDPPATRRWPHALRLVLFVAALLTLFYLVAVSKVIDPAGIRAAVSATGPRRSPPGLPGGIGGSGRRVRAGTTAGCRQRCVVRTAARHLRHARIDGADGDDRRPARQASRSRQRQGTPRRGLVEPDRRTDSAARTVGGGRTAVRAGYLRRPGVVRVRRLRNAVVADGRRGGFHRISAAGVVYTALGASISDLSSPLGYAAIAVWCITAIIGRSPRIAGIAVGATGGAGAADPGRYWHHG